jgi:hypothetical protein
MEREEERVTISRETPCIGMAAQRQKQPQAARLPISEKDREKFYYCRYQRHRKGQGVSCFPCTQKGFSFVRHPRQLGLLNQ